MKTNPICMNNSTAADKGKIAGRIAGFGIGSAYMLKNRKDVFENAVQSSLLTVKKTGVSIPKNKAIGIACCVGALFIGATTLVGNVIGKGIGKVIDKNKCTKKQIDFLNNTASDIITEAMAEPTTVNKKNLEDVNSHLEGYFRGYNSRNMEKSLI